MGARWKVGLVAALLVAAVAALWQLLPEGSGARAARPGASEDARGSGDGVEEVAGGLPAVADDTADEDAGRAAVSAPRDLAAPGAEERASASEPDSGARVTGRVVADASGRPVAGARVGSSRGRERLDLWAALLDGAPATPFALSDERGRFELAGLAAERQEIVAVHPDFAEGVAVCVPGPSTVVEIRLAEGLCVFGAARDAAGEPVAGLAVELYGEELPVPRPVLTGADGRYRTAPARPGRVELRAAPPPGAPLDFAPEWRRAELVESDVQVDFGPSAEHVTWRGTFYGCDGEPVAWGLLLLHPHRSTHLSGVFERHTAACDAEGRFELRKLTRGQRYRVTLWFPDDKAGQDGELLTFDVAGDVERDVPAEGGMLAGVVVDGLTGRAVAGARGYVLAMRSAPVARAFNATLDEEGRFRLPCMPAGTYDLSATVEGWPTAQLSGVAVEEGRRVEDLRIELVAGGELRLRVEGFVDTEQRAVASFELRMQRGDGPTVYHGSREIAQDGAFEETFQLRAGAWTTWLSFRRLGVVQRELVVVQGQTTDVLVLRADLAEDADFTSVAGSLTHASGAPIAAAWLHFYASDVADLSPQQRFVNCGTDERGRFTADGFKPGRWTVGARLPDGGEPDFPDLVIPPLPPDPFSLDLVLPGGRVGGTLFDDVTGEPFADDGPMWWVFLKDVGSGGTVAELQGWHKGRRFELVGVPPGEYRLLVMARGYADHESAPFTLGEGQQLDLGPLRLKPAGVLDLLVEDTDGNPIGSFDVLCAGSVVPGHTRELLESGRVRVHRLPLGRVTVLLRARGFRDGELSLELVAGAPAEARAVLERE